MKFIWQDLFNGGYVPNTFTLKECRFANKICQNDFMYIRDNLINIIGTNKHDAFVEIAVSFSKNIDIIDLLLKEFEIDPVTYVDEWNNTLLTIACTYNTDIDIIKYMINKLKINPHHLGRNFANCLHVACRYNTNLEIIKYLINDVKVDAMLLDNKGDNCLFEACRENDNFEVTKYLIELKIYDIDTKNHNNRANVFVNSTFSKKINYSTVKYIVEKTDVQIDLKKMKFITYNTLLPLITGNHKRLNVLLKKGILMYGSENLIPIIKTLNPLSIYSEMIRLDVGISDPFDLKYQKFKDLVDKLESPVSIQIKQISTGYHHNQISSDSTNQQEILFVHNNKKYFGNKDIVYKSIILLNDIHFEKNEEPIVLSIDVPEYVMNLYVQSCYCTYFMIHRLLPEDFVSFIKLIDQYPTTTISIDRNESLIVSYMMQNNIKKSDYLDNIVQRYSLKLWYMYFSGKLIIDNDSNSYEISTRYNRE